MVDLVLFRRDQSQEKLTTLPHLTSSTTMTTTTTRTTKTSTLLVTHHSSTEPLMSSDVVDQELDDSNDQQSVSLSYLQANRFVFVCIF